MRAPLLRLVALFDPEAATNAALNRRVFVGLGTGAAVAGSTAAAFAASETFGKPHPPIVVEDDPTITVERPMLATGIPAYAAAPKNAARTTPGIVLVQHAWGVDATIRDDVRRLAKEAFVTAAPELYARMHAPDMDGSDDFTRVRPLLAKLDETDVQKDLAAAADWIRKRADVIGDARPPKIGIMGFCWGGGAALRQTWGNPKPYDAAVIFYGTVQDQDADFISMPVMGNYGARDTGILAPDVRAFFAKLRSPHDLKIYPEAGHAFFDDTRQSYVASAAADAWTRTLGFLHKYLSA
jgi:carboxymethylenebutenolidase